jgi:hypothetical protein
LIRILKGHDDILDAVGVLEALAARSGQLGAMQDIVYYLSKPGVLRRIPQLLLFFSEDDSSLRAHPEDEEPIGALLLFEYYLLGCSLKLFTTNDRSGRNTLISSPALRSELASHGANFLLERGAHTVLISYRSGLTDRPDLNLTRARAFRVDARSASRENEIPDYLPLADTYQATLATIGQRTRSNMRYNRRRAEVKLGCTFVPSVAISLEDFLAFNRETMYKVKDHVAVWRYEVHQQLAHPLLMGIRDQNGRWLALIGGRRFACGSEILWQMNRDGLPLFSLSLVARSYFIEHEIAHGSKALYIEGGTAHPIHFSFVRERLTHFAVLRRSSRAILTKKLARHLISEENELAQMLFDPEIVWSSSPPIY